ncbi:MAG TPA: hypothetical protein VNP92_10440 [Actinophytocola sp.]|nr:hypothetical protein [Actinophytocola sp.]
MPKTGTASSPCGRASFSGPVVVRALHGGTDSRDQHLLGELAAEPARHDAVADEPLQHEVDAADDLVDDPRRLGLGPFKLRPGQLRVGGHDTAA